MIRLFFSYAHQDEALRDELEKHLAGLRHQGIIEMWHDRRIGAGEEWAAKIDGNLQTSDVILLLVSADIPKPGRWLSQCGAGDQGGSESHPVPPHRRH